MEIRFTKRSSGKHTLTVVRDDGTVSYGRMVPGLGPDAIPHDLLHVIVERTLGWSRGVFGLIGSGLEIEELLDPAFKAANAAQTELWHSEAVTTSLQSEVAYAGVGPDFFGEELCRQCEHLGLPPPEVSETSLALLRSARDRYAAEWRDLSDGATLEVEFAPERTDGARVGRRQG